MAIKFGPLEIDDELVLLQFRQDLKDDWFPILENLMTSSISL